MKIVFYEMTESWQEEYIKARLSGHELKFEKEAFNEQNLPDAGAEIISTFVVSQVTAKVLAETKNLKFIAARSTGFDQIDLAACKAGNILVSNVPTYGEHTVAEFAFTLMLALVRKLYPAVKRVREQAWFNAGGLRGFELKGKTLGIVGTGHIGAHVAKIAKGFEMNILAFDPHPQASLAREIGFEYVSLEDLLKKSDIITLHAPYMPSTHHLINKDNIGLCKKGSIIVNTARGGLVETQSLVMALKQGILQGAALDVLEEEGFIKEEAEILAFGHPGEKELKTVLADHELMQMDNALITPHMAFNTSEAIERILETTVSNIENFIKGAPINLVEINPAPSS